MFPFRYGRRNSGGVTPRGVFTGGWPSFSLFTCVRVVCVLCSGREPHARGCVWSLWFWLRVCVTSPRPISTGRLGIAAVHLRPINPVFCWGPYPIVWVGNLILKRASRLDAFSGYHFRT